MSASQPCSLSGAGASVRQSTCARGRRETVGTPRGSVAKRRRRRRSSMPRRRQIGSLSAAGSSQLRRATSSPRPSSSSARPQSMSPTRAGRGTNAGAGGGGVTSPPAPQAASVVSPLAPQTRPSSFVNAGRRNLVYHPRTLLHFLLPPLPPVQAPAKARRKRSSSRCGSRNQLPRASVSASSAGWWGEEERSQATHGPYRDDEPRVQAPHASVVADGWGSAHCAQTRPHRRRR
ncbi:hypothetical protein B0H14DRAFT_779397 [Mycena olivaceomarginata]|nr:hypothetical protein B0H14DRAFT_779397 [Mycena olivaceomarginata]